MTFFDVYAIIILATFYTLLLSKSYLVNRKGQKVVRLGQGKNGFARYLELFYYLGLLLLTYLVVVSATNCPVVIIGPLIYLFDSLILTVIGFILLNVSVIIFAFALAALNESWRIGIDHDNHGPLVTHGIFKWMRNPTYGAIIILFTGYFLSYSNFFFLGALIFIIASFNHQIRKEEILLEKLYPDTYPEYKAHTPKYGFSLIKKQSRH